MAFFFLFPLVLVPINYLILKKITQNFKSFYIFLLLFNFILAPIIFFIATLLYSSIATEVFSVYFENAITVIPLNFFHTIFTTILIVFMIIKEKKTTLLNGVLLLIIIFLHTLFFYGCSAFSEPFIFPDEICIQEPDSIGCFSCNSVVNRGDRSHLICNICNKKPEYIFSSTFYDKDGSLVNCSTNSEDLSEDSLTDKELRELIKDVSIFGSDQKLEENL